MLTAGILPALDFGSGSECGASWTPSSIDSSTHTRVTSASAYRELVPPCHVLVSHATHSQVNPIIGSRTNLLIVTNAQATRIVFNGQTAAGLAIAQGVSFVSTAEPSVLLQAAGHRFGSLQFLS